MDISLLGFSGFGQLYNVHPAFVHFPIAFLPASFGLYLLGVVLKRKSLLMSGRTCLYLALAGGLAAVGTGLAAEGTFPHNATIHDMMETHEGLAWAILSVTFLASLWSFRQNEQKPRGVWAFLVFLGLGVLLVGLNADLGARMVYVQGAAVRPASSVIAEREPDPTVSVNQGREVTEDLDDRSMEPSLGHHHH
jgi:uncharacterized membrane protein